MRLLTVIIILPSFAGGGAERVALSLLDNIDRKKFKPILIVLNKMGPLRANIPKENIINLNIVHLRFAIFKLIKVIKVNKPDVIFSTFPHITLPLLIIKNIIFNNSVFIAREPNMVGLSLKHASFSILLKFLYKFFMPKADKIIVTSKAMQNDLLNRGIDQSKLFLIHNPIDKIKIRKINNFIRYPGKGLRLVFAGRLVYQKGIDRILPIIKNLKDCHLTILGNGPMKPFLEKMIIELNIKNKIKFIDFSSNVNSYIASADYLLLPSRWEGLPNVVLESLILGTPVISFKEILGLHDIKLLVDKDNLHLCSNEREMGALLSKLNVRKNLSNISLRKNLLNKFNSPHIYAKNIEKIMEVLVFEKRN